MSTSLATRLIFAAALGLAAFHVAKLPALGRRDPPARPQPEPVRLAVAVPKPAAAQPVKQTPIAPARKNETAFVVKRVLNVPGPMKHGDYVWDEAGVPAGPILITIDLAAQTISVFRDGYEIGTAVVMYGADNMPTPLGTFPILQKDATHVSNLYDAPMPYMLRLTNDGIAIHGGADVAWGSATHGCIGVPTPFAKLLFARVKLGDRVIITSGKMLDVGGAA